MSDSFEPRDELTERLAALGRQPVDPALQSRHLTTMGAIRGAASFRTSLAGRLKVGAGVLAGFLLGATGLTTAGMMGPLQPISADVVEAVAPLDVPKGKAHEAKEAKEKAAKARLADGSIGTQRQWAGCASGEGGKFAGNRGQYLKQERAKGEAALAAAKLSHCGKPVGGDDEAEGPEEDGDKGKSDEDHGKSEGKGKSGEDHGKPADPGAAGKARGEDVANPGDAGQSSVTPPTDPTADTTTTTADTTTTTADTTTTTADTTTTTAETTTTTTP